MLFDGAQCRNQSHQSLECNASGVNKPGETYRVFITENVLLDGRVQLVPRVRAQLVDLLQQLAFEGRRPLPSQHITPQHVTPSASP